MRTKEIKLIFSANEFCEYTKSTTYMAAKCMFRIPFGVVVGLTSLIHWLWRKTMCFCRRHTKAAVIIGFVLCFMIMLVEFVYFKLQLQRSSYETSELIKKNYELEQTDRYDIGYHDAMAKNKEMLVQTEK